jgi:Tol biopolymer transport system component
MRVMTKWALLIGTALLTLWAIGQQPVSFYQRMPVISDDGSEVLYQAVPVWNSGLPTLDVFQMSPQQMTTAGTEVRLKVGLNEIVLPEWRDAARPHFSTSQAMHIVYMRGGSGTPMQVFLYDRQQGREILISGLGTDPANRQPGNNHSVCPRINKNGRIIAFASLDPTLHDPNGDGNSDPLPLYATPTRDAPWIIYVHDRDVDGNGTYDEVSPDPTVITVATYAVAVTSFPYVSLSPDTGGTYIAYQVYDSANRAWGLFVKDWRNNLVTDPPVAVSPVKFSIPAVMGITQPVNGALVAFTANVAFNGNKAGVWLAEIDFSGTSPVVGRFVPVSLNNGVNGAPMISPDATFIAFHTTASDIVIPNVNLFDRNGVDDIYVFDLTNLQPVWSTLLVRNLPNSPPPPIGLFDPCVHPSLSSFNGNNLYIAFEHWLKNPVTGQQQILVRKVQIIPPSNFLFAWKMGRARRYVPLR